MLLRCRLPETGSTASMQSRNWAIVSVSFSQTFVAHYQLQKLRIVNFTYPVCIFVAQALLLTLVSESCQI